MEYEFTFVVDGTTVADTAAVSRLGDELDAMLARAGGRDLLVVAHEGHTALEAAMWAVHAVGELVPDLRILRLDRDLVGIPEIAERTQRSRSCVHQWVRGERFADAGPFPRPEGTAGRAQVWLWAEVNAWLERSGLGDGNAYASRPEMTEIDFVLANTAAFAFRRSPADGYADQHTRVIKDLLRNHIISLSEFMAGLPLVDGSARKHVLALAAADEPAPDVMRFLTGLDREVVLVTSTHDTIMGVHFTTAACPGPEEVVRVPAAATVWDWMALVRQSPEATFKPDTAGRKTLVPGRRVTFEQAA